MSKELAAVFNKEARKARAKARDEAKAAITVVGSVRTRFSSWHRLLEAARAAASTTASAEPDWVEARQLLEGHDTRPENASAELASARASELLGEHAEFLGNDLKLAGERWHSAIEAASADEPNAAAFTQAVQAAEDALGAALQHALFLTFLDDVWNAHPGEKRVFADFAADWSLNPSQISQIWNWVTKDPKRLGGIDLPIVLDTQNLCAYRKADTRGRTLFFAAMPLWGFAGVFSLTLGFFALLRWAGVTKWPQGPWAWKMVVLVLLVSLGAAAHLGSRALDVNYDDPMKVYDVGKFRDWLSLRWVAVIWMYLPVAFVVIVLWGAGNIPTHSRRWARHFCLGIRPTPSSSPRRRDSRLGAQGDGHRQARRQRTLR